MLWPQLPQKLGGQAVDLPPDWRPDEPREVRYLSWTIDAALRDAGLREKLPYAAHRCGIVLGTTLHGMRAGGEFLRSGNYEPLKKFTASATLARACDRIDFEGFAATTCSACSSSLGAITLAMTLLEEGELDLVIAGGYDTISEYVYGGFNSLRLVADGPLRPFAKDRQGMKLAEGYGIVVLERARDAHHRSATMLATIIGYGESADAHHLTQPHPQGEGAARAIRSAIAASGLTTPDIDLVAAHATGTPDNDAGEYAALASVFGDDLPRVPVVAFKSHLGHTLGGAGAVELILSAMALRDQQVPPCANSTTDQVEFARLNLSTQRASKPLRAILNTSLGFGGANTAAIVAPPAPPPPTQIRSGGSRRDEDVVITGIGVIAPGIVGGEALLRRVHEPHEPAWLADTGGVPESDYVHLLNARRVRRMSDYVTLSLAATMLALQDAKLDAASGFGEDCSVVLGSSHGSAEFSVTYYREIVKQGLIGANPVLFAEGVPNAAAAHLSLMLGLKGACQTVIGARTSGLDALHLAASRIRSGRWKRAIVGAGEEFSPIVNGAYCHCGLYVGARGEPPEAQKGFVIGAGAVSFVVARRSAAEERGAMILGRVERASAARGRPNETIESTSRVLHDLGASDAVLASPAGCWIDRAEAAALRRAAPQAIVSSIYGHTAEHFSVTPLLATAAVILGGGRLPRMMVPLPHVRAASGSERVASIASICTDFTGCVSGVRIAVENPI
jgi:3-oxoacyl-[acyl-carrier-protein] synthase II